MKYKIFGILTWFLIFSNCSKSQMNNNKIIIDKLIKKDTVFSYLRKNNQKSIFKEPYNQNSKRTVFVNYYTKECKDCRDFNELYEYYNSKAIIDKSDSLTVKISVDGGLSGSGFFLKYKKKSLEYHSIHIVINQEFDFQIIKLYIKI